MVINVGPHLYRTICSANFSATLETEIFSTETSALLKQIIILELFIFYVITEILLKNNIADTHGPHSLVRFGD